MATFIIMTAAEADQVRGPSLQPIERENQQYILNVLVLEDPEHAAHHEFLRTLPTMDSSDPNFPPEKPFEEPPPEPEPEPEQRTTS